MSNAPIENATDTERVEWLKAEYLRLHETYLIGWDAMNKLAAVASMLIVEGVPLPKTDPPVIIKK